MAGEPPFGDTHDSPLQVRVSPISILPPELLAVIFEYSTVVDVYSPVLLSHVSALWRRTAITTPRLWGTIFAKIPTSSPRQTSAKVRTWLARSGSFPLHISLIVTEWRDEVPALSLLNHLRNHSRHWGRLSLSAASSDIARDILVFFTAFPHHDMLSRIDLSTGPLTPDELFDDDPFPSPQESEDARRDISDVFTGLMNTYAPRLTEFNLATSSLPYPFRHASTRSALPHLRTLRILERNGQLGQIDALSILSILAKCPALESFIYRGSNLFDPHGIMVDIIHLPHLRELHLAQTFHQRIILSHLFTPALEVLRLSWLNRPEVLIDESYVPDPSEVNEGPIEYSQSPYTDILTGAGVRSLIGYGTPPIRVLDMDFADARSPKDFLWVFRHLPTLESFRIVGSDMSDKVLDALASKHEDGSWLCPRLTSLEFLRCDMITGRGVMGLARGRNPPLDCPGCKDITRPARLTRFIIEACSLVDCESVALMQYMLGDVNFEVEIMASLRIYPEEGLRMPE